MTAVPTTLTAVAGAVLTASQWNTNNRDVENWLLAPAILRARQTVSQNITSGGAGTAITFDSEDVDSTGMHSTSSNTSRATAVYPGWYWVGGNWCLAQNATGVRQASWNVNGSAQNGAGSGQAGGGAGIDARLVAGTSLFFLNVGDYLELISFQNSGSTLATQVSGSQQATMSLHWESN